MNKGLSQEVEVKEKLSKQQSKAFKLISTTKKNIFIQGQAGTGKSTFIKYIKEHLTNKNIVICSPTAVAAVNIGGMTLHSFFKIPPCDYLTDEILWKRNRKQIVPTIKAMDILIIDEISMVRPDMLDGIDALLRSIRKSALPFGGVQMLLIGDLYQLPPIITNNVTDIFQEKYGTSDVYFFDSNAYKKGGFTKIEFTKIYRQANTTFINHLNNLRDNKNIQKSINYFNTCRIEDEEALKEATTITPYNKRADEINQEKLQAINSIKHIYDSEKTGSFLTSKENTYPAPDELILKEGALVMLNKNHLPEWINGSTGIIQALYPDEIYVKLISNGETVRVEREEWESKEYNTVIKKVMKPVYETDIDEEFDEPIDYIEVEEKVIEENVTGTFKQFPIQLGYALSIHKAQGKTLDKVIVDLAQGAFAHGQLYVALSRTKNKNDMHIVGTIRPKDNIISQRVIDFMQDAV